MRTRLVVLVTLVVAVTGCAREERLVPNRAALTGTATGRVVGSTTASLALDRIMKREARIDGTMRRDGTGRGVAVYVFDGGVMDMHPELAGRVRIGFDAFPSTPRLCNAHGTAVAGAIAGTTLGVAPDAEIVDVKVIDCRRKVGSVDAILAAARWTVSDHARHPGQPAIANWSLIVDTTRNVPVIDSAVALLRDAGILVVAAAGNLEADACHISPANAPGALVVGASTIVRAAGQRVADVRAPNTAFGRCVDVYAPGDSVFLPSMENDVPTLAIWNGTSMAAGYVSGAAALLLERTPVTSPENLRRALLMKSASRLVDERIGRIEGGRLLYAGPLQ